MNEIVLKDRTKKRIEDILAGECFIHNNHVYMRIAYHTMNALCVELTNGDCTFLSPEVQVFPIKLKMVEL